MSADDISDRCRPSPTAPTVPPRASLGPRALPESSVPLVFRLPVTVLERISLPLRALSLSASLSLFGRSTYISYKDLRVGESVAIYNRQLHLYACALPSSPAVRMGRASLPLPYRRGRRGGCRCDAFTRHFYEHATDMPQPADETVHPPPPEVLCRRRRRRGLENNYQSYGLFIFCATRRQVPEELVEFPQQTEPPYIGFGTEEDSIASFYRSAVPLPAPATPDAMAMKPPR